MKNLKPFFFTALLAVIIFSVQSCKDACDDIVCENSISCFEGVCICQNGFTGVNCEKKLNAFEFNGITSDLSDGYLVSLDPLGDGVYSYLLTLVTDGGDFTTSYPSGMGDVILLELYSDSALGLSDGTYEFGLGINAFNISGQGSAVGVDFNFDDPYQSEYLPISNSTLKLMTDTPIVTIDFNLTVDGIDLVGCFVGILK